MIFSIAHYVNPCLKPRGFFREDRILKCINSQLVYTKNNTRLTIGGVTIIGHDLPLLLEGSI